MNNLYPLIAFVVFVVVCAAIYYLIAKAIHKETFDEAYELGKKHGAENKELETMKSLKYALCKKCDTLYSYRHGEMTIAPSAGRRWRKRMINKCDTCKHEKVLVFDKPCRDCVTVDFVDGIKPDVKCSNWEPKEPCPKPADVEPPKKPKKSKWRKWDEKKPERHDGELEIIATVKLSKPNSCNTRRFFHRVSEGFDYIDNYFVNVYWRYSRKPPKEYRK